MTEGDLRAGGEGGASQGVRGPRAGGGRARLLRLRGTLSRGEMMQGDLYDHCFVLYFTEFNYCHLRNNELF